MLEDYDIEFAGIEYANTSLELTDEQHKAIESILYKAQKKYDANNTKKVTIKLNKKTDARILEWLETQDSVQGAIKKAILYMLDNNK